MSRIKVGHFEPDGSLINLPLGFIPDFFFMAELGATNPLLYYWWRAQEADEASGSQEGILDTAGTKTVIGDAAGITAYDTGTQGPTITTWTKAVGDAATARTATAPGTYVRPSTASPTDRGAIFECVTAGTSASTEPIWPDAVGENVTDSSTVWQRVDVDVQRLGYQGVVIAATPQTNGQEMYYTAMQSDQSIDHGDVDGWTDGIDPDA
jgi:hypothetical protein